MPESPTGPVTDLRLLGRYHCRIIFAFHSLNVKPIFVRPDRKVAGRASQEFHYVEMLFMIASNSVDGSAAHEGFQFHTVN